MKTPMIEANADGQTPALAVTPRSAWTLMRGTPAEIERDLSEVDARISELKKQRAAYEAAFEYEVKSNLRLEAEIARLRNGIAECLAANGHLADGEDCTLIGLKRLLWPNAADEGRAKRVPSGRLLDSEPQALE